MAQNGWKSKAKYAIGSRLDLTRRACYTIRLNTLQGTTVMAARDNIITLDYDPALVEQRAATVATETDEEILIRLKEKFEDLKDLTRAIKQGKLRAAVVSGPPGVGKSHGVEEVLQKDDLFNTIAGRTPKYEIVSGAMSALGLYAKLWRYADRGNVIVFDDCDSVLQDELSLNILKAALDSKKRRYISWNTDSRLLRTEGIPDRFEFSAGCMFITNIKFEHIRSRKLKDHLEAIKSRCFYIDLEMDTKREQLLRIGQIVGEGMLNEYEFEETDQADILDFIHANADSLLELSLRMVLKIADLKKTFPTRWQNRARSLCFRR